MRRAALLRRQDLKPGLLHTDKKKAFYSSHAAVFSPRVICTCHFTLHAVLFAAQGSTMGSTSISPQS